MFLTSKAFLMSLSFWPIFWETAHFENRPCFVWQRSKLANEWGVSLRMLYVWMVHCGQNGIKLFIVFANVNGITGFELATTFQCFIFNNIF